MEGRFEHRDNTKYSSAWTVNSGTMAEQSHHWPSQGAGRTQFPALGRGPAQARAESDPSSRTPSMGGHSRALRGAGANEAGTFKAAQKLIQCYLNCTSNLNLVRWPQTSKTGEQLQLIHVACAHAVHIVCRKPLL